MVWDLRLIGDPGGPTSITGTARFMTTTFYIVITLLSGHTARFGMENGIVLLTTIPAGEPVGVYGRESWVSV